MNRTLQNSVKTLLLLATLFVGLLSLSSQSLAEDTKNTKEITSKEQPKELGWSNLIPEGYDTQSLIKRFEADLVKLDELPDGSPEGLEIIQRIQNAVDMIPSNSELDNQWIKLPGFIAPLDSDQGKITRFLLVPYFGACIHVPPPPVNQTVLVELEPGQGIKLDEADYPFMVTGKLNVLKTTTNIGSAGYRISQATV